MSDWKRVYRDLSNIEDVRITLYEPNLELRMSLKMAFQEIGIRDLNDGASLLGVENVLELGEVDLLIWDASCAGGDVCQFTHDIRHHRLGKTPFLPIITMVTDATPVNIREVIESGPDDLLVKPISTDFLFNRIMSMVERKRLFVVTSDYIGPERRNKNRQPQDSTQIMEVPNPLRDRATGVENTPELQKATDQAIRGTSFESGAKCSALMRPTRSTIAIVSSPMNSYAVPLTRRAKSSEAYCSRSRWLRTRSSTPPFL